MLNAHSSVTGIPVKGARCGCCVCEIAVLSMQGLPYISLFK
jgi:hypothetical protein